MDIYDLFQNTRIGRVEAELDSFERSSREETQNIFLGLAKKVNRLVLLNQAMSEILIERLGITNNEIIHKMNEIDMRDGVKDGRYVKPAKDCPKCDAKINNEFHRCFFCGYIDDDPDNIGI